MRVAGSIVVSHSSLAFISPRPLYRCTPSSFGSFLPAYSDRELQGLVTQAQTVNRPRSLADDVPAAD